MALARANHRRFRGREVIYVWGQVQDLVHMHSRNGALGVRVRDCRQALQRFGGVHDPDPTATGLFVAIATRLPVVLAPRTRESPAVSAAALPESSQIRGQPVLQLGRVTHRRGAFLRAQMLRIRQRIDLIVDLVEPGRSCCRQARPIRAGDAPPETHRKTKKEKKRLQHTPIDNNLECRIGVTGAHRDVAPRATKTNFNH